MSAQPEYQRVATVNRNATRVPGEGHRGLLRGEAGDRPRGGDESAACFLGDPAAGPESTLLNVSRIGSTRASTASVDIAGGKASVPEVVLTEQVEKLKAASGRR